MTSRFRSSALRAGRAIGLYAAGGLAAAVVGFLALPFFTRIFTTEEFGVIGLFTAAVNLLVPVMSLGGYVFLLYDTADPIDRPGVPGAVVAVASIGATVALGGGIALAAASDIAFGLIVAVVATAWANVWVQVRLHAHQAADQPGRYFVLSALPPLAAFGATLLLALWLDGWAPRIVALVLTAGAGALWSAFSLRRSGLLDFRRVRARIAHVVRFGAPLVVHTASLWVVGFTDRFFVAEYEGLAEAGIYTVAYAISLGIAAIHDGVARYFASKLPDWVAMERGRKTAIRFAVRYAVLAVASIPIVTVLAIVGLRVMVPESYAGGSDLLMWLVPAQSLAGVARLFSGFLYVEHRTRHRAALSAAEASFNIALTWPLVVLYGAAGAAAATLATYAVSMVGTVMLAMRGPTLRGVSPVRNPS